MNERPIELRENILGGVRYLQWRLKSYRYIRNINDFLVWLFAAGWRYETIIICNPTKLPINDQDLSYNYVICDRYNVPSFEWVKENIHTDIEMYNMLKNISDNNVNE